MKHRTCCITVMFFFFTSAPGSAREKGNEQLLKELAELRAEVKTLKAELENLKEAEALVGVKIRLSVGQNDTFGNFMAGQEVLGMKVVRKADGMTMGSLRCANTQWSPKSNPEVEIKLERPLPSADKAKYELVIHVAPNTGWQQGKAISISIRSIAGFDGRGRAYDVRTETIGFLQFGQSGSMAPPGTKESRTFRFE